MDASEQLVDRYLRSLSFNTVIYEPDGNVPPDFLADGRVAVEVRRLNQNHKEHGCTKGLEEVSIPIWQRMSKFLPTIGPTPSNETWFVAFNFHRPLEKWSRLEPKIRMELRRFLSSSSRQPTSIPITDNFSLDVFPASEFHGSAFILGAANDNDSGGFVLSEVHKNLYFCSQEKEQKILPYRAKYAEWWLVLPDHIGLGVDQEDILDYKKLLVFPHSWNKIVLLDPRNHARAFELCPLHGEDAIW